MKKKTLYNLTLNWFSLRYMFHHLNLPVQVNKVLIFTSSLIKKKKKTLYCESDFELVFIEA